MGVVTFDYSTWAKCYPTLAPLVNSTQAECYFQIAQLYLDNSQRSIVRDVAKRTLLFGLLVAHIAYLNIPESEGGNGAGVVGRASSATRGSVSISLDYPTSSSASDTEAWLTQTQWGAMFWAAMLPYRQARYVTRPRIQHQVWP